MFLSFSTRSARCNSSISCLSCRGSSTLLGEPGSCGTRRSGPLSPSSITIGFTDNSLEQSHIVKCSSITCTTRQANYVDFRPNFGGQVIIRWNQAKVAIGWDNTGELDWRALRSIYWTKHALRHQGGMW